MNLSWKCVYTRPTNLVGESPIHTEIEELTPDILHSFVDRIYIGETEVYEGQKFQDIKIVYNLVGAIDLPQYAM